MDFSEDAAGVLINSINAINLMECADIKVSDDAADGLITIAIGGFNSTDFSEDAVGGLITPIDAFISMDCAEKLISDDVADGQIATSINADELIATPINSMEFTDTNVSDDYVDVLMMLMC